MKPIKLSIILAFLLFYSGLTYAQSNEKTTSGVSIDRLKHYDNFIKNEVESGNIPGASTLIVRDGAVVHEAAYGYKDVTSKSILKVNDIFYIQSMTKPIVSVAF
ncbi:serine hydrolase, partial [Lutimonas sp.]|uniref:serine hydrolase n=1 Tax=Lutimonas sp. TaxID=1872403 RepID=UPI003D9B6455